LVLCAAKAKRKIKDGSAALFANNTDEEKGVLLTKTWLKIICNKN